MDNYNQIKIASEKTTFHFETGVFHQNKVISHSFH